MTTPIRPRLLPALPFLLAFAALAVHCDGGDDAGPPAVADGGVADAGDAGDAGNPTDVTTAPDGDGAAPDAGDPGPTEGSLSPTPVQPGVSPDGASVGGELSEGEVRAGRITGSETGFTGLWAHCRSGDFKLKNDRIEVCVQDLTTNLPLTFGGGGLVDAKRVGFGGDDAFESFLPRFGLNVLHPESVQVIRDGTDGKGAVIRVEGHDEPIAYLVGATGLSLLRAYGVTMVTEYRLFPGREHVEVVTWWKNEGERVVSGGLGDLISVGDRLRPWRPDTGFSAGSDGAFNWLGAFGDGQSIGWALAGEASTVQPTDSFGEVVPFIITKRETGRMEPGQSASQLRYILVGDGGLESIRRAASALVDEALAAQPRTIRVVDAAGTPVSGRLVELRRDGRSIALGVSDADGEVALAVEPQVYEVVVEGLPGEGELSASVDLSAADQAEVEVATAGRLVVQVGDPVDQPLTAQVRLRGPGGAEHTVVAKAGVAELELLPGVWRVVVNKGAEWDFTAADVEVNAGGEARITLGLTRSVDTTGWISGDFHQHMEPSPDSKIRLSDRVLDNAAQGVEFFASTDHDIVTDLESVVDALGLAGELGTFPGVEVSPLVAHVGFYPMTYDPDARGRGTFPLGVIDEGAPRQRMIPEIIAQARAQADPPVIQMNHPRSSKGLFDDVGFDPELDPASFVGEGHFTLDFDTMEIINRFNKTCQIFRDWAGLLNAGYRKTALGNSDSHDLWGDAGLPRNFMRIASEAGQVTAEEVRAALTSGQVTVGANAFIDFTDGRLPGDLITVNPNEDETFRVRVQTPNWAIAERLVVVVNGTVVDQMARPDTLVDGPIDFDAPLTYAFDEDSWIVFMAWGPKTTGEGGNGAPVVAFTNPIFVDVDGDADSDGELWEAPGVRALELGDLDVSGVCD